MKKNGKEPFVIFSFSKNFLLSSSLSIFLFGTEANFVKGRSLFDCPSAARKENRARNTYKSMDYENMTTKADSSLYWSYG